MMFLLIYVLIFVWLIVFGLLMLSGLSNWKCVFGKCLCMRCVVFMYLCMFLFYSSWLIRMNMGVLLVGSGMGVNCLRLMFLLCSSCV